MSYIELENPLCAEVLSSLSFLKDDLLIASFYDSTVRLYNNIKPQNPTSVSILTEFSASSPILSFTQTNSALTIVGLLDGSLGQIDLENFRVSLSLISGTGSLDTESGIGSDGINFCNALDDNSIIASTCSGSIWHVDPRAPQLKKKYKTSGKILAMDVNSNNVVLGKSKQTIEIYDIRRLETPMSERPTGLRYQISCLKNFPNGEGYAIGSIDGRVSIDVFDQLEESMAKKFAFKCHREKVPSAIDKVYPVTGLAFHPNYETLFTCGGDGHVSVWNREKRKRMKQLPQIPLPSFISHMVLNKNGSFMALGVCDDKFLRSPNGSSASEVQSKVYIRRITDVESKPK